MMSISTASHSDQAAAQYALTFKRATELMRFQNTCKKEAALQLFREGHEQALVVSIVEDLEHILKKDKAKATRLQGIVVIGMGIGLMLLGGILTWFSGGFSADSKPTMIFYGALVCGSTSILYGLFMLIVGKEADDFAVDEGSENFLDSVKKKTNDTF